jgi:hypothetical protein
MAKDPIVEEVRAIRAAIAAEHGNVVLALRFWFRVPAVFAAAGTLCFVVSALSD